MASLAWRTLYHDKIRLAISARPARPEPRGVSTGLATADAYGDRKFWGRVVRIGQVLGRKGTRTDEPTERVDTKALETLIELDKRQELHLGLRVDDSIEVGRSGES